MQIFDTTSAVLQRAIAGAALRQTTLAGNLANVNTPGFVRRDVDFQDALKSALGSEDPASALEAVDPQPQADSSGAMTVDGNSVDVDAESARMSANGLLYEALIGLSRGRDDTLRAAIGSGS
jgi:flagellar basal-body rod protein FlgB